MLELESPVSFVLELTSFWLGVRVSLTTLNIYTGYTFNLD